MSPWIIPLQTLFLFFILLFTSSPRSEGRPSASEPNELVGLSQSFLKGLKEDKELSHIVEQYAKLSIEELAEGLETRTAKLAFWINTYNGFVIYLLTEDPNKFDDRGKFFTDKQIEIAGLPLSLDDIEHGIIRNSRVKLGLGYLKKWFVPSHIKKLRISKREPRIHFALNCGAKSCPPVAIFGEETLEQQLSHITTQYLRSVTAVEGNTVTTTPLFSWFRGDFNGKKGIRNMLRAYEIVEISDKFDLRFGTYDWTLSIGNYAAS